MAYTEISRGEVKLNNIAFKLATGGEVQMFYASQFAPKQVIGDYSKDSDPNRSVWTFIGDQTGGIGIEDMDESKDANRSYWSTLNMENPGYNTLPRLSTSTTLVTLPSIVDGELEIWSSGTSLTNWPSATSSGTVTQSTTVSSGTYSAKLTALGNNSHAKISQTCTGWSNDFRKRPISVEAYLRATLEAGAASCTFEVNDGASTTTVAGTVDSTYHQTIITKIAGSAASGITLTVAVTCGIDGQMTGYGDAIAFVSASTMGPSCEFNGDGYFAMGNTLFRIDNSSGSTYFEGSYPAPITDLVASIGNSLYIFVGDSQSYWYRNSGAGLDTVFTQAVGSDGAGTGTGSGATFAVEWNGQLAKITAAGQLAVSTAPNSATPTWTNKGLCSTASFGTIRSMKTYTDVNGTDQVYIGTTKGLLSHDYTNSKWLLTGLQVPSHTDNGKGLTVQNGRLYYSSGLSVFEYFFSGGVAVINPVGPDKDDGLPDEFVGSIVKFKTGYGGDLFAFVDASLISSSNFSSILRYKNGAWTSLWTDGTANRSIAGGLVTSSYAYRIWYGLAGMNWIALDRVRRNPIKVNTSTYAATGIYISPWFDAAWMGNKNALALRSLALSSSSTEIVTLRYRIDKATTNVVASTAGWTTLDTLVAADAGVESVVGFASSAGVAFKEIQFRSDMTRAAGTTTNRPILVYSALEYERVISSKWGWSFTVDCSQNYGNRTPLQLRDAIISIVESQTLVPFAYGGPSEPRYVRVKPAGGERLTGQGSQGIFRLVAVEK